MSDLGEGELVVVGETDLPAFNPKWSLEEKFLSFQKWFFRNFVDSDDFYFDFSDWLNEDDLEIDVEVETLRTSLIVREAWGINLTEEEVQIFVSKIDGGSNRFWKPIESRVHVEQIDEDLGVQSLEELQDKISYIQEHLETIEQALPKTFGHNLPPENFLLKASDFAEARLLTEQAILIDEADSSQSKKVLISLAQKISDISLATFKYFGKTSDTVIQSFASSFGGSAGKVAGTGVGVYLAANGLSAIAEMILKFIG